MEPEGSFGDGMQGVLTFTECKREENEMECREKPVRWNIFRRWIAG
jgi:hypothetical protein